MRTIIGTILLIFGIIVLFFGDKSFGKEGKIEKIFFPKNNLKSFKWVLGGLLIYFGIVLIFNKLFWLGIR